MKGEERVVEGEYGVKLRKKIWVAAAAVALALTTAVLVLKSAGNGVPPFIHELGGKLVDVEQMPAATMRTYRIPAKLERVVPLAKRDLPSPKWTWESAPSSPAWEFSQGSEWFVVNESIFAETGATDVLWISPSNWLDTKWGELRQWMGLEPKPEKFDAGSPIIQRGTQKP